LACVLSAATAALLVGCGSMSSGGSPSDRQPTVVEGRLITDVPPDQADVFVALYEGDAEDRSPDYADEQDETYELTEGGHFILRAKRRASMARFYVYANVEVVYTKTCVYRQLTPVRVSKTANEWVAVATGKRLPPLTLRATLKTDCY
jgi:hypothetical protein